MKEDNKLIDAIIDLGVGMKELRDEMKAMRKEQHETNQRLEKLEKHQQRTNAELSEIRLTFVQYADAIEEVPDLKRRVHRLEKIVLK